MSRAEEMTVGQIGEWYFGLAEKWPEVFPDGELAHYWNWTRTIGGYRKEDHPTRFVPYLRAGALRLLRAAVGQCEKCPLHQHRLTGRPVLDDCSYWNDPFSALDERRVPVGATTAQIMMVAEGPGAFEQRTGVPFVTYQILAGSPCASECSEYENCFSPKSRFPQQACKPVSLKNGRSEEEILQIRTTRAEAPKFPIQTVASILDNALVKAGLWREGWNGRQAYRPGVEPSPKPGSVYLCNMVKCRSCKPRDNGNGFEDVPPTVEQVSACSPYLEMQVHIIQPKVIVAVGNPAVIGTTGISDPKVLSMRGNLYPGKWGLPVLVEVHPSYIHRQPGDEQSLHIAQFVTTLEKAKQVVEGSLTVPWMSKKAGSILLDNDFPAIDGMSFPSTFDEE